MPNIITIESDSNEPEIPSMFGRQLPIIPPSSNNLNLPPNRFIILATRAVVQPTTPLPHDMEYSPLSPEPSDPSPISTPQMNLSTIDSWHTTYTSSEAKTFYCDDKPQKIYFFSGHSLPPSPREQKRNFSNGTSFLKKGERRSLSAKPPDRRSLS